MAEKDECDGGEDDADVGAVADGDEDTAPLVDLAAAPLEGRKTGLGGRRGLALGTITGFFLECAEAAADPPAEAAPLADRAEDPLGEKTLAAPDSGLWTAAEEE